MFTCPMALFASSVWTPVKLAALRAWWRADLGVTDATEGQPVSLWADQSGNGFDLAQADADKRPVYDAVHAEANGKPAVQFVSEAAVAAAQKDQLKHAAAVSSAQAGFVAAVFAQTETGDFWDAILALGNTASGSNRRVMCLTKDQKLAFEFGQSGEWLVSGEAPIVLGQVHLALWISDGATWRLRLDGVELTVSMQNGSNVGKWFGDDAALTITTLGYVEAFSTIANHFPGRIHEALVADGAPSADDIAEVESYLAARYGITLS